MRENERQTGAFFSPCKVRDQLFFKNVLSYWLGMNVKCFLFSLFFSFSLSATFDDRKFFAVFLF